MGARGAAWHIAGGIAVLFAALALANLVAPSAAPPAPAPAVWSKHTTRLAEGQANLREGEAWVGTVNVARLVLHDITATLTWADDQPATAPDDFTLELVPPQGLLAGAPAEGRGGLLAVSVPVYARLPPPTGPYAGQGAWTVRIHLGDAGDGSTAGVLPGAPDNANDFHLVVDATAFTLAR